MFSLKGKTAVVTGGGRGIGRGIAKAMAAAGANVLIVGRTDPVLKATEQEINAAGGRAVAAVADITSFDGIGGIVDRTLAEFGYIDCWVNNAGSANARDVGRLMDLREDQWNAVVDLNLKWTFFAAQAAARTMSRGGSIINISSRSAAQSAPMIGQYGAAKAGVENLTATMSVEWGHLGIRVNAIQPGVVLTEDASALTKPSRQKRQIETTPLQRLGVVDDVGPAAVYLASDEASWVSGIVLPINGGARVPLGLLTYLHHVNQPKEESGPA